MKQHAKTLLKDSPPEELEKDLSNCRRRLQIVSHAFADADDFEVEVVGS